MQLLLNTPFRVLTERAREFVQRAEHRSLGLKNSVHCDISEGFFEYVFQFLGTVDHAEPRFCEDFVFQSEVELSDF